MKCATTVGVERHAMISMSIRSKGFMLRPIKTPYCHLRQRYRYRHRHGLRTLCVSKDRSESEVNPTDAARERIIEDLTRRLQVAERALQVGWFQLVELGRVFDTDTDTDTDAFVNSNSDNKLFCTLSLAGIRG